MRKEHDVLLEEYNTLSKGYNTLSEEYNTLSETNVTCEEHHDDLLEIHQENMLFLLRPFLKSNAFCSTFACFRRSGHTYKRKEKVMETAFATFVNFCILFHAYIRKTPLWLMYLRSLQ